jgi:hypothetical protein
MPLTYPRRHIVWEENEGHPEWSSKIVEAGHLGEIMALEHWCEYVIYNKALKK